MIAGVGSSEVGIMGIVIGVIGGYAGSGRAPGGAPRVERRFLAIDRDSFDEVFRRFAPRVELGLPYCDAIDLARFEQLDPEDLARSVPALSKLLEARDAVGDPSRMRALIHESGIDTDLAAAPEVEAGEAPEDAPVVETTEAELLDAMVEGRPLAGKPRLVRRSADPEFDRMVAEIVGEAAERTDHAARDRWRAAIDRELAARLRAILHHPNFRRLEAGWRSLRDLVRQAETGESLRLRVLGLSREELLAEATSGAKPGLLHRRVVEEEKETPGGEPFSLLLVDESFDASDDDVRVLEHLAALAARAEVPCVVGVAPSLWSGGDFDWERAAELVERARSLPGAERLGLLCPRLLARLPFGAETEPVEAFAFEETDGVEASEGHLWANPIYALGRVAVQAFAEFGALTALAKFAQLDGLPVHVYRDGSEVRSIGPTDRLFTDSEIELLNRLGLNPVVAVRGRDVAFVASFRSVTGAPLFSG
jgi:type VI secretion system protein ImpC